jgi:hypothetical protein
MGQPNRGLRIGLPIYGEPRSERIVGASRGLRDSTAAPASDRRGLRSGGDERGTRMLCSDVAIRS